jgi:hypothetical protein
MTLIGQLLVVIAAALPEGRLLDVRLGKEGITQCVRKVAVNLGCGSGLYRRSWTSLPTPFISAQRLSERNVYAGLVSERYEQKAEHSYLEIRKTAKGRNTVECR